MGGENPAFSQVREQVQQLDLQGQVHAGNRLSSASTISFGYGANALTMYTHCMHMHPQHTLHKKARVFPHAQEERKAEKSPVKIAASPNQTSNQTSDRCAQAKY